MTLLGQVGDEEVTLVNWFFSKMDMVWGGQFKFVYPDDNAIKMAKIEWTEEIIRFSRDELDLAFKRVKTNKINMDKDAKWPDVAYVLGQCTRASGGLWG